ncbi:MAG: tripartite tricarboxylate transporter substrate binding protein [Proteobacteria bacterium]|nr:tripartite tricarboxylate transporter substrate binding protein [Pseudomonadota bacterium]
MLTRRGFCAGLVMTGAAGSSLAQTYPAKPVKVIVPFAPGGSADVVARLVCDQLTKRLGQPFIVDNVPGASGNIGTARSAQAAADGYTLLAAFSSFAINPSLFPSLPYDITKDFKPVSLVAAATHVVVVNPSVAAKSIRELEALINSKVSIMSFAHGGVGTPGHLLGELYRMAAHLDLVSVPFNGAGPAVGSVLGGHTPMGVVALSPAFKHITEGRLRALAVTSKTRYHQLPDVPTMIEAGRPDIVGDLWVGMLAPGKTPDDVVKLLNSEIRNALQAPELRAKLQGVGFDTVGTSPDEFATQIAKESAIWGKIIREAKIEASP